MSVVGDLSQLLLACILWSIFLPHQDTALRLALFVPVSWLLFQLSYAETIDWAAPGIQNLYIAPFSFATFIFLTRNRKRSFYFALLLLVLSIATSGNGFITAAVGLLLLFYERRFQELLGLCSFGMIVLYGIHYNLHSSQVQQNQSLLTTLLHLKLLYVFSFIGSLSYIVASLTHLRFERSSVALGIVMVIVLAYLLFKTHVRPNPTILACILFLLLTAVGVAGIRSDFGLGQAAAPRYRVYSSLFFIFLWFLFAERFLQDTRLCLRRSAVYLAACAASILFALRVDAAGDAYLRWRNDNLVQGVALFEQTQATSEVKGPFVPEPRLRLEFPKAATDYARPLLIRAAELGIFNPPGSPQPSRKQ